MLLKREHVAAWKINWIPKPDNLRMLSAELGLSLDSFVFIDDDAFECEAVRTLCQEVLVLPLPADEARIEAFFRNIWDLDQKKITVDDQNRTLYYRQDAERARARSKMSSIVDFLASLELEVQITSLLLDDLDRAAQLTERTNQFNLNGIRRSVVELQTLMDAGQAQCMMVRACDRFGDHGTVGLIIYCLSGEVMKVDTLLLSCRALGKGVEQYLAAHLARAALSAGASRVDFAYRPTTKNAPIQAFLAEHGVSQVHDCWTVTLDHLSRGCLTLSRSPTATVE
jgi:FkbH-like protein